MPSEHFERKSKISDVMNVFAPARDGTKISATLVMPEGEGPFPAILEIYPYRKDDYTSLAEPSMYRAITALAEAGYVVVRADIRGTGSSEGFTGDMYEPFEMTDGYDLVEWAAEQPWCTGKVGLWGSSYGGVNSFQIAMHNPPHLRAIIPMLGTDEIYLDTFYPGGCPRVLWTYGNYGPGMLALTCSPPDPDVVGDRWAEMWKMRLENNSPWLLNWIKNQTDSQYWREKSLNPDFDRIKCPTFIIGGWFDAYPGSAVRAFSNLEVPKRLLIGPWTHMRMDEALPGPQVDYVSECIRWFDQFLKDKDTGVLKEPPITIFVRRYNEPAPRLENLSGFWRHESGWPIKSSKSTPFYLREGGLLSSEVPAKGGADAYEYNPIVGVMSGVWAGLVGGGYGLPMDQRYDEAYSLAYTTGPLAREVEVTGTPQAILHVSSSADIAYFSANLCDVASNGTSVLVSKGILNATHRSSHAIPSLLRPDEIYELRIEMTPLSYIFEPGHRMRLNISSADFPTVWPSPKPSTNRVQRGPAAPSRILVPIAGDQDPKLPPPALSPSPLPPPKPLLMGEKPEYNLLYDFANEEATYTMITGMDLAVNDRTRFKQERIGKITVSTRNPSNVVAKGHAHVTITKPEFVAEVETYCITTSNSTSFNLQAVLDARLDGRPYFSKQWSLSVPRIFT